MQLQNIKGIKRGDYYPNQIMTELGIMQICLHENKLLCNFIGLEDEAKEIFGHWKPNTIVESEQDIQDHLDYINREIKIKKQ
jgi:hypothetical protein